MLLSNPFLRRTASRSATLGRARTWTRDRLTVESLEIRNLLSAAWPGLINPQQEVEPNNTLDFAQDVGQVGGGAVAEFVGSIVAPSLRNGDFESPSDSSTDVDWFSFTLVSAGRVQVSSLPDADGATSPVVLTLYGDQLAEFDPAVPLQHQLLGRQEGDANGAEQPVDLRLEAGTYFVAVSGAGNRFFHPFTADSGVPGESTDYGVRVAVTSGRAPEGKQDQFAPVPESGRNGDDTSKTANNLGDLTAIERLQVTGTIGDDRFYDVLSEDSFAMNPAADVDLYRFTVTGDGTFGLIAESFAGRIGSPLDPALTLFRADDSGALQFVATNNNSFNPTQSTNGQYPFGSDAVLFSGLSAGEYFLAVSSSGNDSEFGTEGVFDPRLAHSGINGGSVGTYVVDLLVYTDNVAPEVVGHTFNVPGAGEIRFGNEHVEIVPHAPTHLSVQFSESVNLQQLANSAFSSVGQNLTPSVFIEGGDGTRYFPRLQSYDSGTETAQFLMLDGLPNGEFTLHISGALGLTDLAGNLLVSNDASGDYVTHFSVDDTAPIDSSALRTNASGNDSLETAQDLGVLFPHDLQSGIKLVRNALTNADQPADTADYFRFEVLQSQTYFFTLSNFGAGSPPAIKVLNEAGQVIRSTSLPGGKGTFVFLSPGNYVLRLGPWDSDASANVTYQATITLGGASEYPTPLTSSAAPAVGIRLVGQGPAPVFVPPVVLDVPQSQVAPIPSGLLVGLNAPALGGQGLTTPAFSTDTALVRLFGFSNRDQLFSLIDSSLRRASKAPEVTQAELTSDELRDLLNQNRNASNESSANDGSAETVTDEELPADMLETGRKENAPTDSSEEVGSVSPATSNDEPRTGSQPAAGVKKTSAPATRSRAARPARIEIQSSNEQPPAAFSAPLAFALATSLAGTLRQRSRREKEQTRPNPKFQIPMSIE